MKRLLAIFVFATLGGLLSVSLAQNKEFSWVYLYYTNSFGSRPTFTMLFNGKETIQLEKRARVKCKIYSTGNVTISCFYRIQNSEKQGESSVALNIQPGKSYYVKLDNNYLKLKLVDETTGKKEFNDSKLAEIQNFEENPLNLFNRNEPANFAQATNDTSTINKAEITNQKKIEDVPVVEKTPVSKQQKTAEKTFIPSLRIVKPIPSMISGTATWDGAASLHARDFDISSWGFGVGLDARIKNGFRLFFDATSYFFTQDLVKAGQTGYCVIGMGSDINFPKGVKYNTSTTSMRLGIKYVYEKNKTFQPWVGVAYGLNIWNAKYITWDEEEIYGKAKGITMRSAILAGIDLKYKNMLTFTLFFDAIAPVAKYTMKDLFGAGDYNKGDATTYPSPRIGFSIGGF